MRYVIVTWDPEVSMFSWSSNENEADNLWLDYELGASMLIANVNTKESPPGIIVDVTNSEEGALFLLEKKLKNNATSGIIIDNETHPRRAIYKGKRVPIRVFWGIYKNGHKIRKIKDGEV